MLQSCIFCSEYSVLNLAPTGLFIIPNGTEVEAVCDGIVKWGGTTSLGGKNGKGAKDTAGLEWLGPILENIIIISFFKCTSFDIMLCNLFHEMIGKNLLRPPPPLQLQQR